MPTHTPRRYPRHKHASAQFRDQLQPENWFLRHLSTPTPDRVAAAKLLVTISLGAFVICLAFTPVFYYFDYELVAIFLLGVTPFTGLSAFLLRWTGSLQVSVNCYLLSSWLLITGVAILLGGINSPAPPAYYALVLGATFMIGRIAGIVWTGVCMLTVMAVELTHRYSWFVPEMQFSEQLSLISAMAFTSVLGLVGVFALKYDSVKNAALEELRTINQRTGHMIAQLEQASNRLIRSSEQFLGSGETEQVSIMGRMMQTAHAGRHTIEEARESILGMIEQYRQISERVQNLYRHSQNIVELVSSIDRISDRLDIMALNVGIEAARSGEPGKQFAILAQDMRGLAQRVLNETRRIKTSLESVHQQVQVVLDSSASGQGMTEESANKMKLMVNTFDNIYDLIEQTEGATEQMTADTLAQIDAVRKLVTATERRNDQEINIS